MFFDDCQCGHGAVFDVSDEAVAAAGQGLDVAGFVGRITKYIAQLFDGAVQAGIESTKVSPGQSF